MPLLLQQAHQILLPADQSVPQDAYDGITPLELLRIRQHALVVLA